MNDAFLALVVGTVLAVGALAYVLYPLFFDQDARAAEPHLVAADAGTSDDDIEARVRAYREARRYCRRCGLRPEPDALYCSTCGDSLDDATD